MKCPVCGCQEFYVKDPEDEFETHGFSVASGDVRFADEGSAPEIQDVTETYCDRCSWHGGLGVLKKG